MASKDDKEKPDYRTHTELRFIGQRNDKGNFKGTGASLKSYAHKALHPLTKKLNERIIGSVFSFHYSFVHPLVLK